MARNNVTHIREGNRLATALIYAVVFLVAVISLYPVYYVLILSLSSPEKAITMQVYLWPDGFYLKGYEKIFSDKTLWISYRNTVMYAASQMLLMLFTCSTAAYALSSKSLRWRKLLNMFLLIPMYFSGGIIPLFLVILQLASTTPPGPSSSPARIAFGTSS